MSKTVLVLNAGSSSIKFGVYDSNGAEMTMRYIGEIEELGNQPHLLVKDAQGQVVEEHRWKSRGADDHRYALKHVSNWLEPLLHEAGLIGVGHRVVHGGLEYSAPTLITEQIVARLESYVPLAPLHQPASLAGIRAAAEFLPGVPQVVCFDTAFHRQHPRVADQFALPVEFYNQGMRRLFRQFSTPGGIPSHVSVTTPGSIHEGGELGYVLAHAFGAAFDNPNLLVVAVVGDGEAETGPLAASWKSIAFLNPVRDGAVLPILHLNGYKISGPTVLGRTSDDELHHLFGGHGYELHFVEGDEPMRMHQAFAATLDTCYARIRAMQDAVRTNQLSDRPRWPLIVLRTPKGWTGPHVVDSEPAEGTFRSHQVPIADVTSNPEHLAMLEEWIQS